MSSEKDEITQILGGSVLAPATCEEVEEWRPVCGGNQAPAARTHCPQPPSPYGLTRCYRMAQATAALGLTCGDINESSKWTREHCNELALEVLQVAILYCYSYSYSYSYSYFYSCCCCCCRLRSRSVPVSATGRLFSTPTLAATTTTSPTSARRPGPSLWSAPLLWVTAIGFLTFIVVFECLCSVHGLGR